MWRAICSYECVIYTNNATKREDYLYSQMCYLHEPCNKKGRLSVFMNVLFTPTMQ